VSDYRLWDSADFRAALWWTITIGVVVAIAYYAGYVFEAGHVIAAAGASYYWGRRRI
jgi:hypothetical protein